MSSPGCGGFFIILVVTLVVIFVVDVGGSAVLEPERHPPVPFAP